MAGDTALGEFYEVSTGIHCVNTFVREQMCSLNFS